MSGIDVEKEINRLAENFVQLQREMLERNVKIAKNAPEGIR